MPFLHFAFIFFSRSLSQNWISISLFPLLLHVSFILPHPHLHFSSTNSPCKTKIMKLEALQSSWSKNYFPSSFLSRLTYSKSLFPKLSTNCNFLFLLWNWGCMFNLEVEKVCISDDLKLEISSPFLVNSRCISFHSYLKFQFLLFMCLGMLCSWNWNFSSL